MYCECYAQIEHVLEVVRINQYLFSCVVQTRCAPVPHTFAFWPNVMLSSQASAKGLALIGTPHERLCPCRADQGKQSRRPITWDIIYFVRRYPINSLQLDTCQRAETTWVSLISSNFSTVNSSTAMPWLSDHYDILCDDLWGRRLSCQPVIRHR